MLKKLLNALMAVVFVCFTASVAAAVEVNSNDPYELIKALADNTFSSIKANKDRLDDTSVSRGIIRTELLPYIDNKYASLKVINQNLKQTTEEQRNRFVAAFTDYIIATYADALKKYTTQTVEVQKPNRSDADDAFTSVKVFVKEQGAPDLEVIFKLRKNKKTGQWKIYDMVAEGISLLSAKQSELSGLIRDKGIDAVSKQLNEHVAATASKSSK